MNVQVEVLKVVADFIAKYRMFTAYDVTKMVRHSASQLGLNDRVSHYGKSGVQELVHEFFSSGQMSKDYARTIATVDANSGQTAFVYHDQDDDPNVYDSVWVEREIAGTTAVAAALAPIAAVAAVAAAFSAPVAPTDDDQDDDLDADDSAVLPVVSNDYVIIRDGRGRACIPAQAIKDVKAANDDMMVAVEHKDRLVLIPGSKSGNYPPGSVGVRRYMIDKSGNVRVSRKTLVACGIHGINRYYIDVSVDPSLGEIVLR